MTEPNEAFRSVVADVTYSEPLVSYEDVEQLRSGGAARFLAAATTTVAHVDPEVRSLMGALYFRASTESDEILPDRSLSLKLTHQNADSWRMLVGVGTFQDDAQYGKIQEYYRVETYRGAVLGAQKTMHVKSALDDVYADSDETDDVITERTTYVAPMNPLDCVDLGRTLMSAARRADYREPLPVISRRAQRLLLDNDPRF